MTAETLNSKAATQPPRPTSTSPAKPSKCEFKSRHDLSVYEMEASSQFHYPHIYRPIPSTVPYIPDLRTIPYISYLNELTTPLDLSLKNPIKSPQKFYLSPKSPQKFDLSPKSPQKFHLSPKSPQKFDLSPRDCDSPEAKKLKFTKQFFDDLKQSINKEATPVKNVVESSETSERPKKCSPKQTSLKKSKTVRRLTFDEDKSSPVSGTIIRDLDEDETLVVRKGDIDPAFNVVEITEEAKALIASIENKIGSYLCRLCKSLYEDAFALAQHRCSRIVHIEYRCPECDKVFNCPANLASHRRWHKPRPTNPAKITKKNDTMKTLVDADMQYSCKICCKTFRRQAYLRKHLLAHENKNGGKDCNEISAFKEVRSNFIYNAEITRDDNHNDYYEKIQNYYENIPKVYSASIHSEDSRDLDITGSEDEGEFDRCQSDN